MTNLCRAPSSPTHVHRTLTSWCLPSLGGVAVGRGFDDTATKRGSGGTGRSGSTTAPGPGLDGATVAGADGTESLPLPHPARATPSRASPTAERFMPLRL